jgi:hypothetical protein
MVQDEFIVYGEGQKMNWLLLHMLFFMDLLGRTSSLLSSQCVLLSLICDEEMRGSLGGAVRIGKARI